jgi:hypothetical protein
MPLGFTSQSASKFSKEYGHGGNDSKATCAGGSGMYFEQKESRVQWARIAGLDLQLPPVKFQA